MWQRPFFHEGMRELQDRFDGRRVAEAIEDKRKHYEFWDDEKEMMRNSAFFFIATSWQDYADCSIKSGDPGFVKIVGPNIIEYPEYDGNSMYRTLGNISRNPNVGLLFVRLDGKSRRIRVNGRAAILDDAEALGRHFGAKLVVRIECEMYPNCPRYLPDLVGRQAVALCAARRRGRPRHRPSGSRATTSATSCPLKILTAPWFESIASRGANTPGRPVIWRVACGHGTCFAAGSAYFAGIVSRKDAPMSTLKPLQIDIVSDVVCPWCYIGKRRIENALALVPDVPVEVHWRPFFLNSWVPREGISRDEYLTAKFGSVEAYKGIAGRVVAAASEEGLDLPARTGQAPAQHHRLPPPDPLGRSARQIRRDEAAADGIVFPRRRRSHRRQRAGAGGGRYRARCRGYPQAPRHRRGCRADLGAGPGRLRQGHLRRADLCVRAEICGVRRAAGRAAAPARSARCRRRSTRRRRSRARPVDGRVEPGHDCESLTPPSDSNSRACRARSGAARGASPARRAAA